MVNLTDVVALVLMVLAVPLLVGAFVMWFGVLGPHIAGRPTGVRVVSPTPTVTPASWHHDLPVIPAAFDLPRYQTRAPQAATLGAYADPDTLRDILDPWRSPQRPAPAESARQHDRRPAGPPARHPDTVRLDPGRALR